VVRAQRAEEADVDAWVRRVMAPASAVDVDPGRVGDAVGGLQALFEANGLALPLHPLPAACQYRLGARGARLSARLVNGRLMARSGPSWVDVWAWLERQPLPGAPA
jgi:hypothetical protein